MEKYIVNSSFIAAVVHDKAAKRLDIEMKSGHRYRYYEVPTRRVNRLLQAESIGRFFCHYIKGKFKKRKLKVN